MRQYPVQFVFNGSYYTAVFAKLNGSDTVLSGLLVTSITPHGKGIPTEINFISNQERTHYTVGAEINSGFASALIAACLSECKNRGIPEF